MLSFRVSKEELKQFCHFVEAHKLADPAKTASKILRQALKEYISNHPAPKSP